MAKVSDARIARGEARPLEGIPLGIKDLFATHGVVSTAGSNILKNFEPPYESTVTHNLWSDGAVMLGKLNLDEFAMGSSNETSAYGPVTSPWRRPGSNAAWTRSPNAKPRCTRPWPKRPPTPSGCSPWTRSFVRCSPRRKTSSSAGWKRPTPLSEPI